MRTICVAGIYINIESADETFFDRRFKSYECAPVAKPDMVIKSHFVDSICAPAGELVLEKKDAFVIRLNSEKNCRCVKDSDGKIFAKITYKNDYSDIELQILNKITHSRLTPTDYEYIYTGFMFSNRMTMLGGTVLHGSSIAVDGEGVIFSANPGVGKSTHTGLWRKRFGDRVSTVNDDKPVIRIENGKAFIYGTPWSGKTDLNENVKYPLKAIVFISRGEENSITDITVRQSIPYFIQQLPNPFYDGGVGTNSVKFLGEIYNAGVKVCYLKCNISEDAVKTSYDHIFKGE